MKRIVILALLVSCLVQDMTAGNDPRLFFYFAGEREGFHVAASDDGQNFEPLGQLFTCDYSSWGSGKRMFNPYIIPYGKDGAAVVFQLIGKAANIAVTCSADLITWRPQDYPLLSTRENIEPRIRPLSDGRYDIIYKTGGRTRHVIAESDLRHFSADSDTPASDYDSLEPMNDTVTINGQPVIGRLWATTPEKISQMRTYFDGVNKMAEDARENLKDDMTRFANLGCKPVLATLSVDTTRLKPISDKLIGVFFEDISYGADGGLYAEMLQNRDFEYSGRDARGWTDTTAWHSLQPIVIATDKPLSSQNPHYAIIKNNALTNEGWDGMAIRANACYDFSMFARGKKRFIVQLANADGKVLAQTKVKATSSDKWKKYTAVLVASQSADSAHLTIIPQGNDKACIDMVSLFPQDTYKGRKNGLRRDLAETIAAVHPKFVRFPGGCMSHGKGLENIYHWQNSIGPLEERVPDTNAWHYHQTRGLGFYELFQWCEDMGAEPVPVLSAGVCCQNSGINAKGYGGQQGGLPMNKDASSSLESMPEYIDELCNLIEWANGDPATSEWAAKRAEAGHPASFNLKYIGIGNEDLISTVFEDRFKMIGREIKRRYPGIKIIGTAGPFHAPSSDYAEAWRFALEDSVCADLLDEHYYESVGWFLNNRHYYDNYDRRGPKVYLGEYAARDGDGTLGAALAEAAYLTDIERNGDVVEMTSYAPLLCKERHGNWRPDMIYFNNISIRTAPSYETQRLYGNYAGDKSITSTLNVDSTIRNRVAASVVRDSKTGNVYLKVVNILPVSLQITLNGINLPNEMKAEGFEGKPGDTIVKPHKETISSNSIIMPPYSFRVIRLN